LKTYSDNEFIKVNRKITDWEWYKNFPAYKVFTHCLFKANWKEGKFEGETIPRGSFVTSVGNLAKETGLSVQQVRTALNKLKSTNEITIKTTNKFTVINVVNYSNYQDDKRVSNKDYNRDVNNQITNEQQTNNKQITTIEEVKKIRSKEVKNNKRDIEKILYFEVEEINVLFHAYLEMRKKKKVPNTEHAINLLLNKLKKHDDDVKKEMLEKAIVGGWQSLYEPDSKQRKSESALERLRDL